MRGGGGGVTLSARLHNALFVLFIGGILAYGAGFAWYMLARFDLVNLIRDVNTDDSFYYFQIAYNLAEGRFSTFDGGITRTNGYHPLWMLLITPFYWVFDKETALFGIKAFEIMLVAGGVALVATAARLARMPWYLMFAALPILYQRHTLISGMEAAAALFMLGLFILTVCLFARSPARWQWPLAAVAFALPWVRLEYIAISLATTGALCLVERSWQESPSPQPSPVEGEGEGLGAPEARGGWFLLPLWEKARMRGTAYPLSALNAVVPLLGAIAGILVYFAYNQFVFDGIVPVSGAMKQVWSQWLWASEGGYSLTQNLVDILQFDVFDLELCVALEICAYLLLVWWFTRRSHNREDRLLLAFLAGVSGLAVGHLTKFGQTVLTMHPHFGNYDWYFVPAYLMMALIIPVRCYVAIHFVRRFVWPRWPQAANVLIVGIIAAAIFLLAKADFTHPFRFVDRASGSTGREWEITSYTGTQVMNHLLPEDSVVGSWDAGVIGYFSRFPVVNLDGLVNSYDYLRARKERPETAPYRWYGITHFMSVDDNNIWRPPDNILFEGQLFPHPSGYRRSRLLTTEPPPEMLPNGFDRSAKFWERMEPHFDYQSDGAGLLVDGRLVQAFARECDPGELAVWSWAGPGDEAAARAWTKTQTGLCVNALVLPRNALPPVRVETMPVGDYLARLVGDRQPAIRADFDVYLTENSLVYVKEQCTPEDAEPTFFLHLYPVDTNDLPSHRQQYGFDNLDFVFRDHRRPIKEGVCVARRKLPDYAIATLRTGQFTGEGRIWEGGFDVVEPLGGGRLIIRSDWNVYLVENSLIYAKDQCSPEDVEPMFFLHLDPVDMNDLPSHRQQYGFDNLDFAFGGHRPPLEGEVCVARRELPDYAIAALRTGQFTGEGQIWEDGFDIVEPADDRKTMP